MSLRGQELEVIKLKKFSAFGRIDTRYEEILSFVRWLNRGRSFRLYATFGRKWSQYYGPQTRWDDNHCFSSSCREWEFYLKLLIKVLIFSQKGRWNAPLVAVAKNGYEKSLNFLLGHPELRFEMRSIPHQSG